MHWSAANHLDTTQEAREDSFCDLAEVIGIRFGFNRSLNAAFSFGRFVNPSQIGHGFLQGAHDTKNKKRAQRARHQ